MQAFNGSLNPLSAGKSFQTLGEFLWDKCLGLNPLSAGKSFQTDIECKEIVRNNDRGIIRSCHPIEFLNSTVISDIREGDQRNITIRLKLMVIDYIVSQKNGALLAGSKDEPIEISYDVEIVRIDDRKGKETPFKLEAINTCISE